MHTHVWDLYSKVLTGTYAEQEYESASAGVGERFFMADLDYLRDRNTLTARGTAYLRPLGKVETASGGVHTVEAGVAHETQVPHTSFTATLLLTSNPRLPTVSIYSRTPFRATTHARPPLQETYKSRLLDELIARIDGAS